MVTGKLRRMQRLVNQETGRIVFIPMDDGLIDGPKGGLLHQRSKIEEIVSGGADGVLGFKGMTRHYESLNGVGVVLNLTASTSAVRHTHKKLIGSVEEAIRLGADGVAVHVNFYSEHAPEMLESLGKVGEDCYSWGMPLLALMYPRGELDDGQDNNFLDVRKKNQEKYADLVAHASRVGVELGADIIKTQYTGSSETFKTVVDACGSIPVVIAGGPKVDEREILSNVYGAVSAGGSGVCIGRNGFHRDNTTDFVKALRDIVHYDKSVEEAMGRLQQLEIA